MAARRLGLAMLASVAALVGCAGADPAPAVTAKAGACDRDRLGVCEAQIAAALAQGDVPVALVGAYVAAREARDPADAWASVWRALSPSGPEAAIVIEGGAPAPAIVAAQTIRTGSLPPTAGLGEDALLLAMADAAGRAVVVHIDAAGSGAPRVTELFPRDPLAPFTAGLLPIARDDGAASRIDAELAVAALVREALEGASAFDYVASARAADRLRALVLAAPVTATTLRGRLALDLLGAAGILLDAPGEAAPLPAITAPAPARDGTPYGDWLQVKASGPAAWPARRDRVLAAVAADRRQAVEARFAPRTACDAARALPPLERRADLAFVTDLPVAGGAPDAWLARYGRAVSLVDEARAAFAFMGPLLAERGETIEHAGAGTETYQRVTDLALRHLAALEQLGRAEPARYRPLPLVGLAVSKGLLGDPRLRDAAARLSRATVAEGLARAAGASQVVSALTTGLFTAMTYPPALRDAHLTALDEAFEAALRGPLAAQTGWGVAGLHAGNAAFRRLTGARADLAAASDGVARALAGEHDGLATLAVSAARYAALADAGGLDPDQRTPAKFPPGRRAARDELERAVARLGPAGEAPRGLLDDVTTLADGTIAALARRAEDARGARPLVCPDDAEGPSPTVRRAVAKLGDVRLRIFANPRWKQGDGAWIARARLLVTVLSDALDLLRSNGRGASFTIDAGEAERHATGALATLPDRASADALIGGYMLARAYLGAGSREALTATGPRDLRRVLAGLAALLREDGAQGANGGAPEGGVALLDALAAEPGARDGATFPAQLAQQADAFFARGARDQGDLLLIASLGASLTAAAAPPQGALDVATKQGSRVAWALRLHRELARARGGEAPDPAAFAASMREAGAGVCDAQRPDAVLDVMGALRAFAGGERLGARASLDRALDDAEARGLAVPKLAYDYAQRTATKVLTLSFDLTTGAALVDGGSGARVGLGVRSAGEPGGAMTVSVAPATAPEATREAARFYVHTAAIAAAYHFLERDTDRAIHAAQRAIAAATHGAALGGRGAPFAPPDGLGRDARAMLAVDAQLAAEAGLPLLAGDLWTLVRASFDPSTEDREVAALLASAPTGLAGVSDASQVVARARRSLEVALAPLACTRVEPSIERFDFPDCHGYPLALALRVADALPALPRLARGAGRCDALGKLDAFLATKQRGTYDPDAFTAALAALDDAGLPYEAAVITARHRSAAHCSPSIVATARRLGRSPVLGPSLHTDMLSVAVHCAAGAIDDAVAADLRALEAAASRLPDPARERGVVRFTAELAARSNRWDLLANLASPGFVDRWMRVGASSAIEALLLDHAAAILGATPLDLEGTRAAFRRLCEVAPPTERAPLCAPIGALRSGASAEEKRRVAREAVDLLVASAPRRAP